MGLESGEANDHSLACGGMLDGVVDQVDEGLLEGLAVSYGLKARCFSGAVRELKLQLNLPFGGVGLHQVDCRSGQSHQIRRLELVLLTPLLDAREIEHIFDQG